MKRLLALVPVLWMLWGGLVCLVLLPSLAWAQMPNLLEGKDSPLPQFQLLRPEDKPGASNEAIRSLFYRQPWQFSRQTFAEVWQDLQALPARAQALLQALLDWHNGNWWLVSTGLGALLLLGLLWWLDRRFQKLSPRLTGLLPSHWHFLLRRLFKITAIALGRMAFPLFLVLAMHIAWGAFPEDLRYFPLLIDLLWIFVIYRGTHTALSELLVHEAQHFFRPEALATTHKLYKRFNLYLLFSALFWMLIVGLRDLGYRSDFNSFLVFVYACSLFAVSAYFLSLKNEVFSLFPEIDEPFYQRLLFFLRRFYTYVAGFTLLLGLFWLMGYHRLTELLFLRSWAIVGLVLGVRLLQRLLKKALVHFLAPAQASSQQPSKLVRTIMQASLLIEVLVLINGVTHLLGIRTAIAETLSQPIASIGEHSLISPLSFINGCLTLLIFWLCARILLAFLEERVFPERFEIGLQQMITLTVFYVLMALGVLMALNVMGLDLSVFAIFAGALAFGIGFGLQGIAKNFASGLILIFTGLVKKGDYITIEGKTGYIQDVSWKKVHLRTPDHVDLIIPTVDLVESTITNWTFSSKESRLHVPVGVAYGADMDKVKQALLEAATEHAEILNTPAPDVWMVGFGNSSVDFELLVWIDCTRITPERLKGELNFMIWRAFQRHEIEIPFPQQDLHLRSGWEALSPQQRAATAEQGSAADSPQKAQPRPAELDAENDVP